LAVNIVLALLLSIFSLYVFTAISAAIDELTHKSKLFSFKKVLIFKYEPGKYEATVGVITITAFLSGLFKICFNLSISSTPFLVFCLQTSIHTPQARHRSLLTDT